MTRGTTMDNANTRMAETTFDNTENHDAIEFAILTALANKDWDLLAILSR